MDFFKQASRDYDDPKIPVEQRGVSLVLKLRSNRVDSEAGVDDDPIAKSISVCDYDKDGSLDCYITVADDSNILYKNLLNINNWINL